MGTLLIDTIPLTFKLEESKEDGKLGKVVVRGEFARCDKATENKRLYKSNLWEREITRLSEGMQSRRVFGELDHPADGRTKLQRVSHLMTGLRVEGHSVVGEAEILDTPNGRILKTIMEAGAQAGVSSRGFGSTKTKSDGTEEVQEDFRLDTFDFVADPATKTAYPKIFSEERQYITEEELTLDGLKANYPGLIAEMTEATTVEAEADVKVKLAAELRRKLEQLDEAVEERVRAELLEDPEVGGARQILERIASMVASFASPVVQQQELSQHEDKVKELESKIEELQKEKEEMAVVAKEAAYRLHMERKLGGNSSRDTIVKLLGDVKQFESIEDLDTKLESVLKELSSAKDESVEEEGEVKSELLDRIKDLEDRVEKAEDTASDSSKKVEEANERTRRALDVAEQVQVEAYVQGVAASHPLGSRLIDACDNARSIEEAETIVDMYNSTRGRTHDEDEAERIRARVGRGKQRSLEEDTFGGRIGNSNGQKDTTLLEDFGLSGGEFDELAGTGRVRS